MASKRNSTLHSRFLKGMTKLLLLFLSVSSISAQTDSIQHNFSFQGQVSAWGQYAPNYAQQFWLGGRYTPQVNYEILFPHSSKIDFELSANIFGEVGTDVFKKFETDGKVKPYRAWARYSIQQMEIRLGLQKINFGSAQLFRPLMWFDRVDPRDPLQMTDGVWGGLFRYYFQNNANIWFWGLYGNDKTKGWETAGSAQEFPEIGGRIQLPIKGGEIAMSYHFRDADFAEYYNLGLLPYHKIAENRLGFDIRLDYVIGIWSEGSWTHLNRKVGTFTNQTMLTIGGDYTFGIGNGLALTVEQLLFSSDEKAFHFDDYYMLTGTSLSYPLTMSDKLSAMFYFDWNNNSIYNFINWQHDFNNLSLYTIAYWNPENILLPSQTASNRFAGKGVQLMLVWNY